jgi:TM2 domain-containing membrane protein YozV
MPDGQAFCDKCGQGTGETPAPAQRYNTVQMREKGEGTAAVLSFLIAGLGQIYVGRIKRGLGIMLVFVLMSIFTSAMILLVVTETAGLTDLGWMLLFVVFVFEIALWIWNIFDAHRLAKEYNDSLRTGGSRPW